MYTKKCKISNQLISIPLCNVLMCNKKSNFPNGQDVTAIHHVNTVFNMKENELEKKNK